MKSFKDFSIITETTVPPDLLHIPAGWDHHSKVSPETKEKIANVFNGKHHGMYPLDELSVEEPDVDVSEHLEDHGYKIKDYNKGIATKVKRIGTDELGYKDKLVEERIGSILDKTKAPSHVKSAYMNDPARQAAKKSNTSICVTTTPRGIAGMTVGTSWENESCMNLKSGMHRHKLKDDAEHGTHVAYLVNNTDKGAEHGEPDDPISRIAIKPYHSSSNDTIFRAENRQYGANSSKFANAVSRWADKHYPAVEGDRYEKNQHVYNDTNNTVLSTMSNKSLEKNVDDNHGSIDIPMSRSLPAHQLDHIISYVNKTHAESPSNIRNFIYSATELNGLSNRHVRNLYDMTDKLLPSSKLTYRHELAMRYGNKFTTRMINHMADNHGSNNLPFSVLMSKKLPDNIVDQLHPSTYGQVSLDKIKPHHLDKLVDYAIDKPNSFTFNHPGFIDKLNKDQLLRVTGKVLLGQSALYSVIAHPDFDQQMHDIIKKTNHYGELPLLRRSKFAKFTDDMMGNSDKLKAISQNEHIVDDAAIIKIKNDIVKNPLHNFLTLSNNIGKHFTPEDYDKISSHRVIEFANPAHSNKLLDVQRNKVLTAHKELEDHFNQSNSTDQPTMDKALHLQANLKNAMSDYANTMDDHLDGHVRTLNDEQDLVKKDSKEWNNISDRVNELKSLKHFDLGYNSGHYMSVLHRKLDSVS